MRKALVRTAIVGAAFGVVLVSALSAANSAPANYRSEQFTASLSGSVGSPKGDTEGHGHASLTISPDDNRLCYSLTVSDIASATGAQLRSSSDHEHSSGDESASLPTSKHHSDSTLIVSLKPPSTGSSSGCVNLSEKTLDDIVHHFRDYYVVILNKPFPQGALRGYLQHHG